MQHLSKLSAIGNHNLGGGCSGLRAICLDFLDYIHAIGDASEDNVLAIKPVCFHCAQEELRPVGVGSSISHGENTWSSVFQLKVFICEFLPVDGLSASAIAASEVATLRKRIQAKAVYSGLQRFTAVCV